MKPSSPTRLRRMRATRYSIRTVIPGRFSVTYSSTRSLTSVSSCSGVRSRNAAPWRRRAFSSTQWVSVPLMFGASSAFWRGAALTIYCKKYPNGQFWYFSNRVGLMRSPRPSSFSSSSVFSTRCSAPAVSAARRTASYPGASAGFASSTARTAAPAAASSAPGCWLSSPSTSSAAAGAAASWAAVGA